MLSDINKHQQHSCCFLVMFSDHTQHPQLIIEFAVDLFQSDIMDVNQIFKDLAVMIHDQGEMIGEWESGARVSHLIA